MDYFTKIITRAEVLRFVDLMKELNVNCRINPCDEEGALFEFSLQAPSRKMADMIFNQVSCESVNQLF